MRMARLRFETAIKLAKEAEPSYRPRRSRSRRTTAPVGAPIDDNPIASGEREFTRFDFQDLLERRALDIAQPDVARAAVTEIRHAALTSAHGVRLAPHAWGSGLCSPRRQPPIATSLRSAKATCR